MIPLKQGIMRKKTHIFYLRLRQQDLIKWGAAFRKGVASYCGYENAVEPGMWAGGVVGLKSILGVTAPALSQGFQSQVCAILAVLDGRR